MTGGFNVLFSAIGGVVGVICGLVIGRFSIYYSLYQANTMGDEDNPEYNPEKKAGTGEKILCVVVGSIFVLLGVALIIGFSLAPGAPASGNGAIIVFGVVAAVMGGLVIFGSQKS